MSDRDTVVNALGITAVMVTGAQLATGRLPSIRPAIGLAITAAVLLAGVEGKPGTARLSRQFAVVIATTATLTAGAVLARATVRYLSTSPTP